MARRTRSTLVMLLAAATLHMIWTGRAPAQDQNETAKSNEQATATANDAKEPSFFMVQKLRFSKEILTGLAKADFQLIGENAELMQGLTRAEAFIRRGEGYRDQLRQFQHATRFLVRAARDENLDGATLAFNQLTISCVTCHKHLRETP